jgi:hypothetical protein
MSSGRISNNTELYAFINSLIDELKQKDQALWADRMSNAMSISAMAGEILGELRLALLEFRKTRLVRELNRQADLRQAIRFIDRSLGFWRPFRL